MYDVIYDDKEAHNITLWYVWHIDPSDISTIIIMRVTYSTWHNWAWQDVWASYRQFADYSWLCASTDIKNGSRHFVSYQNETVSILYFVVSE